MKIYKKNNYDGIKWRNQFKWQLCQTHISWDWYIKGRPDIISHTSQQRTQRKRMIIRIIRWQSFTKGFLTRFLGPQFADRTGHEYSASLRRALVHEGQRLLHGGHGGAELVPVEGDQHLEVSHRDLLALLRHVADAVTRVILPYQSEKETSSL